MEYLVKISKKARILEIKRRHLKIMDSDILYAVSIKEDTAYLFLHFTRNHEDIKINTPYPDEAYTPHSSYRICFPYTVLINTAYSDRLNTVYRSSDTVTKEFFILELTMTKVIKEEFEKLESLKIGDGSFACDASLEIFHEEFNRMSIMNDDLFTYEVEIFGLANIPCDLNIWNGFRKLRTHGSDNNMEYDPTNVEFTEWLASKFYNHKTMDQYTKNALWIYWTRGDDEVELTYKESSDSDDDDDEVAKIFRINTNISLLKILMDLKLMKNIRMIGYMNGIKMCHGWKEDGYCNGGNLPGAYIVGNTLCYQDLEWYEAFKDRKLNEEALQNKAIVEGIIDEDDESSNEGWRRWDKFENTNHDNNECEYEMEHEDEERCELFDDQERPDLAGKEIDKVVIMEYLVKISKKARILELKQRHFEDYYSDIQYAVSIKEDTAYLCLYFTKYHAGNKINTPAFDEDVVDHIAKVLEILDLINIPFVDSHQLRMKVFPLLLADDARQWWIKEYNYGNPRNTATDSFFKSYDEHDIEEGNELRQMRRKDNNKNDEQPNKKDVRNGQHVVGRMMDTVMEETCLEITLLETRSITKIMNVTLQMKERWNVYDDTNHGHEHEINHEADEREELYEEYVAIKEDDDDDLAKTSDDACRAYQEIFLMMDEGWMDLSEKEIDDVGKESTVNPRI
ncbi:hypothetical protein Tco_1378028 [Tanacetum coccineum]